MNVDRPLNERRIEQATKEDLPRIIELQRMAFKEEADIVGDPNIPPMTQTVDELGLELDKVVILKCVENDVILGSVRAFADGGTCHINRLIVHPEHWNRGIGTNLMKDIEDRFRSVERYELWTRIDNHRTRPFYERLGYRPFRTELVKPPLTFVYLEKFNQR